MPALISAALLNTEEYDPKIVVAIMANINIATSISSKVNPIFVRWMPNLGYRNRGIAHWIRQPGFL
jgi:hypothetical protein